MRSHTRTKWRELAPMLTIDVIGRNAVLVVFAGIWVLLLFLRLREGAAVVEILAPFLYPVVLFRVTRVGLYISDYGVQSRFFWWNTTLAWHEIAGIQIHPEGRINPGGALWIMRHHGAPLKTPLCYARFRQGILRSEAQVVAAANEIHSALAWYHNQGRW